MTKRGETSVAPRDERDGLSRFRTTADGAEHLWTCEHQLDGSTYMARRHGGLSLPRAVALGIVSTLLFFAVFELWFGVPLAKGPIETWLGY